jgi:putative membrane protein
MKSELYARFKTDELILRDYLAADRTVLANERTLLSYVRTAMAFAASGAALIQFFDSVFVQVVGWVLISLAIGILAVGAQRYLRMSQRLVKLVDRAATKDVP